MFTENFYCGLAATVASGGSATAISNTSLPLKNLDGTIPTRVNAVHSWLAYILSTNAYIYSPTLHYMQTAYDDGGGVVIGTGTEPATIDDYKLSGDLISTFTFSKSIEIAYEDTGVVITALYTITNTGSAAFTIGEIGLIAAAATSGSGTAYRCLLERTVLDTPVTVEAGGVGQITYTLRLNYPTT